MKSKTKKRFQRAILYILVGIFVLGTVLLYLPVTSTTSNQTNSPPPLNQIPAVQQNNPVGEPATAPPGIPGQP